MRAQEFQPPTIKVGDEVMLGKFKNRRAEVKGFAKDKNNQPVLQTTKGDTQLFKPRISKLKTATTESRQEELSRLVKMMTTGKIPYDRGMPLFQTYTQSQQHLLESLDQSIVDFVQNLQTHSPTVNDSYYAIPVWVVGNQVFVLDCEGNNPPTARATPIIVIANSSDRLKIKTPSGIETTYPCNDLSDMGYNTVILCKTVAEYQAMATMFLMKFDVHLPEIAEQELDEGWKDWVAGGAMALGALGAHGDANAGSKYVQTKTSAGAQAPQGVGSAIKVDKSYAEPTTQKSSANSSKSLAQPGKLAQNINSTFKKMTPEQSRGGYTPQQLKDYIQAAATRYLPADQVARFMGEVAHETANFTSMVEQNPEKNLKHYAKRGNPLGNADMNDAQKYIGRGYLQITGKWNYQHFGDKIRVGLGDELVKNPDMALRPDVAAALAVVYWRERVAPKMDAGASSKSIATAINGKKPKGLKSREAYTRQAAADLRKNKRS
jgi:predicted chitinase